MCSMWSSIDLFWDYISYIGFQIVKEAGFEPATPPPTMCTIGFPPSWKVLEQHFCHGNLMKFGQ